MITQQRTAHIWLVGEFAWGALIWALVFGPVIWEAASRPVSVPVATPGAPERGPRAGHSGDNALAQGARQADAALLRTIRQVGVPSGSVQLLAVEARTDFSRRGEPRPYTFQHVQISLDCPALRFMLALRGVLDGAEASTRLIWDAGGRIRLESEGVVTHELSLVGKGVLPMSLAVHSGGGLAVVVDDVGEDMDVVRDLLALDFPVALAVWPRSRFAREAADAGYMAGRDILIHQPMESPHSPAREPGTLYMHTSRADAALLVREGLRRVPYAVGLSNHLGARFTTHRSCVQSLCQTLAQTGLFVLDNVTHPASLLYDAALAAGIPATRRTIFLDNLPTAADILAQLELAEEQAILYGNAVAVGNARPETVAALRQWGQRRNRSVPVVPLRQLIWPRDLPKAAPLHTSP